MAYVFDSPNGKVMSTEPYPNGNMWYATASYVFLMRNQTQVADYVLGLKDLWRDGVLSRRWDRDENTSIDDYLAASCLPEFASAILHHGRTHLGFFNCQAQFFPELRQWLWRFPGMWINAKITAGEPVGIIGQLLWSQAIKLAAKQPFTNTDGWLQSSLMVLNYLERGAPSSPMNIAVGAWRAALNTKQPWELMRDYITIEDHPLVDAWKTVKL